MCELVSKQVQKDRELYNLFMERSLLKPIPAIEFPENYSIISINEENGHLWEQIMTKAFEEEYKAGTFRYIIADNYYYEDNRVFVLLNENNEPIATATSWHNEHWWENKEKGSVIFVGVDPAYREHKYGSLMVNYVLNNLKELGFTVASLDVEENNLAAIKCYINCGFTPHIVNTDHIEAWNNQYMKLSLSIPDYDKSLRPLSNNPYPTQISPYTQRHVMQAERNGDTYIKGNWEKYNMYAVDSSEFDKLEYLFTSYPKAQIEFDHIRQKGNGHIFIDQPLNPTAVLLERNDGPLFSVGQSQDHRFINGIKVYFELECSKKYKHAGIVFA